MATSTKLSLAVLGLALIVAVLVFLGRTAGESAAVADKERLSLVWPGLMDMPQADRAFLVGLAMTCKLGREPVAADAVVACLRRAAIDTNPTLPVGVDKPSAPGKLETMLRERGVASPSSDDLRHPGAKPATA